MDKESILGLLAFLSPQDKGNYAECNCPKCGHHEAFFYFTSGLIGWIHCNRRNNCGYAVPILDLLNGQIGEEHLKTFKVGLLEKEERHFGEHGLDLKKFLASGLVDSLGRITLGINPQGSPWFLVLGKTEKDKDRWLLPSGHSIKETGREWYEPIQYGEKLYVVEGVWDFLKALDDGLRCTASVYGARGKISTAQGKAVFMGHQEICIVPQSDTEGERKSKKLAIVTAKMFPASKISWKPLPFSKEEIAVGRKDYCDYRLVHSLEEFLDLPELQPPAEEKKHVRLATRIAAGDDFNDLGNARRLIERHGKDLRFCFPWTSWLIWDGKRWRRDQEGEIFRRAAETAESIQEEANRATGDKREVLWQFAQQSKSLSRLSAMIELGKSQMGIPIMPEKLDRDPWSLNLENGILDLRTGKLREHSRESLVSRIAPGEFIPGAVCPAWEDFLEMIFQEKRELIEFVRRAVGYSLTGITSERCLFILHGAGRNGKTTFLETVSEMLSAIADTDRYAVRTPTETLMIKRDQGIPNDIARLKGARFVFAAETEDGQRLAESAIKDMTGDGTMAARFMRSEWFDFVPQFKLWLGTNHKPQIRGTDNAIWDRIRLIPFAVRIPDEKLKPRHEIRKLFQCEMSGILNWAVQGCLEWQKNGLGMPEEIKQAGSAYRNEMDVLGDFLDGYCQIAQAFSVASSILYDKYKSWAEKSGESYLSHTKFTRMLRERGFESFKNGLGTMILRGISIRVEQNTEQN